MRDHRIEAAEKLVSSTDELSLADKAYLSANAPSILPFRKKYGPRIRVVVPFTKPSRTKQNFQAECDINGILARYEKTGLITHVKTNEKTYANLVGFSDYHSSLNQVIAAQEAFQALPSHIRSRFGNDPGQFVKFMENPKNQEEAIELGLATRRPSLDPDGPRPTDSAVGPSGSSAPRSGAEKSSPPAAPKKGPSGDAD